MRELRKSTLRQISCYMDEALGRFVQHQAHIHNLSESSYVRRLVEYAESEYRKDLIEKSGVVKVGKGARTRRRFDPR